MPTENTGIHDLLAGLQAKPLQEDPSDDVLFAGSRRHDGAPRRMARGTNSPPNLFEMPPPPPVAGPLPPPQLAVALPYDRHLATVRVGKQSVGGTSKKVYFIPAALAIGAAVLVAVLMGGKDAKPAAVAAAGAPATDVAETPEPAPAAPVTPTVEPIPAAAAAAAVAPAEAAGAAPAQVAPSVTPIESTLPKDAVAPAEVVPASTFAAKTESTLPTVASADAAGDAKDDAKAHADEAAPAPAKAKKSRKERAREKRAAKRAAKRSSKRHSKQVARAERSEKTDSKLNGNGALSVSSSQPREVWVDGRNSKRMTPVRVLLKPGKHKVTLFDKTKGTAKTFEVEIKPNTTTKVAK